MPSWGRGVGGGWRGPWVSGGLIGTPRCHVTQIPRHATVLKVVGERQQVAVMHLLSLSARLLHLPIRWGGRERKVKGLSERWKCIYKIKKRFREKGITRVGGVNREQVDETRLMGWKRKKNEAFDNAGKNPRREDNHDSYYETIDNHMCPQYLMQRFALVSLRLKYASI